MSRTAFCISYDGVLEPLGQSQVLPYLEHLTKDRRIHIPSFEKAEDWAREAERCAVPARIKAARIHWHPRWGISTPQCPSAEILN